MLNTSHLYQIQIFHSNVVDDLSVGKLQHLSNVLSLHDQLLQILVNHLDNGMEFVHKNNFTS